LGIWSIVPQGTPARIIGAWQHAQFKVVISSYILDEIKKVLSYPKVRKYLTISEDEVEKYLTLVQFFTDSLEIDTSLFFDPSHSALRDKKDSPILATLVLSQADYLVTGDKDLLVLKEHYPILDVASFAQLLD